MAHLKIVFPKEVETSH